MRWMPRSRGAGCLLWILVLIVVLVVASVVFGSFQKGTRVNGGSLTRNVPVVTIRAATNCTMLSAPSGAASGIVSGDAK
jgi:hypothetical protein